MATFASNDLTAQTERASIEKHHIGFVYGYGGQAKAALNENYLYEVVFLQFEYYHRLFHSRKISVEWVVQPQYNLTRYRPDESTGSDHKGYEYGVNLGILVKKWFSKSRIGVYLLLGVGPHYVSGTPSRQSPGFLFSDNIALGVQIRMSRKSHLVIRPGFRHISNAGMKDPNGGVNNLVFSTGIVIGV